MPTQDQQLTNLANNLRGDNYGFIIAAAERAAAMGPGAENLISPLCECLEKYNCKHYGVVIAVATALGKVRGAPELALPALIRSLEAHRESHYGVSIEIAKSMSEYGELGKGAIPAMRATLECYSAPERKHFGMLQSFSAAMLKIDPDLKNDSFVMQCWEEGTAGVARFEGLLTAVTDRIDPNNAV